MSEVQGAMLSSEIVHFELLASRPKKYSTATETRVQCDTDGYDLPMNLSEVCQLYSKLPITAPDQDQDSTVANTMKSSSKCTAPVKKANMRGRIILENVYCHSIHQEYHALDRNIMFSAGYSIINDISSTGDS